MNKLMYGLNDLYYGIKQTSRKCIGKIKEITSEVIQDNKENIRNMTYGIITALSIYGAYSLAKPAITQHQHTQTEYAANKIRGAEHYLIMRDIRKGEDIGDYLLQNKMLSFVNSISAIDKVALSSGIKGIDSLINSHFTEKEKEMYNGTFETMKNQYGRLGARK